MACVLIIYVFLIFILLNPVLRRLVWNRIRMPDIRTAVLTKLPCVLIKMSTLPTNHNITPNPADCTAWLFLISDVKTLLYYCRR